jgi:hypothetical protein
MAQDWLVVALDRSCDDGDGDSEESGWEKVDWGSEDCACEPELWD